MEEKNKELDFKCKNCGANVLKELKKCEYCGTPNKNYVKPQVKEIKPNISATNIDGVGGFLGGIALTKLMKRMSGIEDDD